MSSAPTESSRPAAPDQPAHAGIHFPPPFIYLGGIIVGWWLGLIWPLPITRDPDSTAAGTRSIVAALLALGYVAVFVSAFVAFRRARTTLIPNRPATAIVTEGPYRWTRNPMYVSLTLLYLAVALWMNNWWVVALLLVVLFTIQRAVIAREERYLSAAFPDEYAAYRARVRRWV